MQWNRQRMQLIRCLFLLAFQNPHDGKDCAPVTRGHRRTEQLVDLAEIVIVFSWHLLSTIHEEVHAF